MNLFLNELDRRIQQKHLLHHPFYQAWSKGELSKECLIEYAKDYYHHVKAFPTYLSALHSHVEEPHTRRKLLENLVEEEAGTPNHPELWHQFARGLGASEAEIDAYVPSSEMQTLVSTFKSICSQGTVSEGLAALYAYESQIPTICVSKIQGLKEHYGIKDAKVWRYFSVHIGADEEHAAVERELLNHYVKDEGASSLQAADRVLDCLWNFLTGLCHKYQIAYAC